jgi:hypothetical protein
MATLSTFGFVFDSNNRFGSRAKSGEVLLKGFLSKKVPSRRSTLRDELERVQWLSSFTESGYDLSYSWPLVFSEENVKSDLRSKIERRGLQIEDWGCQVWYRSLWELHQSGAPLRPFLQAWLDFLITELERESELFIRSTPQRVNVILLLFMLVPAIFILLSPILFTFSQ